ncbi:Nuclear actin-protein involved in chromatin remodeling, partial [Spiromyces aspiralis]
QEDTFGADDEDWSIYRDISKEEDEEEEEEDRLMLMQYNELLEKYAPDYLAGLDRQACERIQSTLMYRFTEGTQPAILEHPAAPLTKEQVWQREVDIMARRYQLHLNVERIRVPEVLFQPSILGIDQTGVVESICQMIKNIGCCPQDLVKNVFVTGGGFSTIPGLKERLACDLRQALPLQTDVGIRIAKDPFLDAWRGAAKWAAQPAFGDQCVTRDMYLECGSDYLKEHSLGNLFYRPTAPQVVDGVSTLQQKGTKAKRSV